MAISRGMIAKKLRNLVLEGLEKLDSYRTLSREQMTVKLLPLITAYTHDVLDENIYAWLLHRKDLS